MNKFDAINEWITSAEISFVNLVSAIAPWLAPIAPAYMTYAHATGTLHFPIWVAVPVSLVVEILGFSAVSTFMAFWFFNRRNKASGKKAPISFVVFAFLFYLAIIITSNVLLDAFPNATWAVNWARALFTLQTIPAALIVISRAGHNSLLAEIEVESKKKVASKLPESQPEETKVTEDLPTTYPHDWRKVRKMITDEQVIGMAKDETKNIAFHFGVDERTALNWRNYARIETGEKK
jgi:hypothetical protein